MGFILVSIMFEKMFIECCMYKGTKLEDLNKFGKFLKMVEHRFAQLEAT